MEAELVLTYHLGHQLLLGMVTVLSTADHPECLDLSFSSLIQQSQSFFFDANLLFWQFLWPVP